MKQNSFFQAAAIVAAGILLALVANAFASRDRKVSLVGTYPNALKVPAREAAVAPPPVTAPPVTQTVATTTQPATMTVPPTATTATERTATAAIETVGLNPAVKKPVTATAPPAPTPHSPPPTPPKEFTVHPDKPYIEIAFNDVKALHDKNVLFLDARRTSVYEQGHIPGARTYSVWESDIDDKVRKLFDERSDPSAQALPIVIYCSGGDCEDSHMLAQKLWGIQFNNVYVYKDGFPDWQQHGAPVHTGANP
ncbi:MAG TPA: rhodanese-like domain-containing protein [Thermoanaerobaculia bacterium]|jgi:rhodanese-related sulfurtransferase|nr:rhodanese-like domain-containing protein [Thermoanaerobaculia bacterium]